jgi:hypothetical protein
VVTLPLGPPEPDEVRASGCTRMAYGLYFSSLGTKILRKTGMTTETRRQRKYYEDNLSVKIGKILRIIAAGMIIALIGYFYSLEIEKNWASIRNFKLVINIYYLLSALSFYLLSYLLETYIWQVCINKYLGRYELNFSESFAVVNSSGLLKYLPGRVWTYTAQLVWLKKYGISKSIILYVNLICVLGSLIVSLYLGLIYLVLYTDLLGITMIILSSVVLVACNIAYITWNSALVNKLISAAGRLFNKEIQPLIDAKSLTLYIQLLYLQLISRFGLFSAKGSAWHPGYACGPCFNVLCHG